jgi:hypothetical protein
MTDRSGPFNGFDLQEAIDLRWTQRNTWAKRWFSFNPYHLYLIETHEDKPALTMSELDVLP